jgi:hypothetical protein
MPTDRAITDADSSRSQRRLGRCEGVAPPRVLPALERRVFGSQARCAEPGAWEGCEWGRDCVCRPESVAGALAGGN